jgi:maleate cis-trans isomerase
LRDSAIERRDGAKAESRIFRGVLENDLVKPVLSAHIANIWGSFKPLNIKVGSGYGALLESL